MKRFSWRFLVFPLLGLTAFTVVGFVIMYLWNWLMPAIFGLTVITFWQSLGLFALAKLLFSGFGGRNFGRGRRGNFMNEGRKRWMNMTAEERKAFMESRSRFGGFGKKDCFFEDLEKKENNE